MGHIRIAPEFRQRMERRAGHGDIEMKLTLTSVAVLAMTTATAHAGGLDRSGQPVSALFEPGGYAELSYGFAMPSIDGVFMGVVPSGSVAPSYGSLGMAIKTDVNDRFSAALIVDQPFGAAVEYTTAGYPLNGSSAHVDTMGITALGRFKISEAFSVYAGPRIVSASGDYTTNLGPYSSTYSSGSDLGYVVGAAFEKPEIALRVALSYSSATTFALDGTVGDLNAEMPQSINLDVQSGIAANTLLFGSVRWADWDAASIVDTLAGPLVDYDQDSYTYTIGVGRKFSESFSGSVSLGYEAAQGGEASNLSPTDGYVSVGIGGKYTKGNMEISAGVRYVALGDATTELLFSEFSDNAAIGAGVKVAFRF